MRMSHSGTCKRKTPPEATERDFAGPREEKSSRSGQRRLAVAHKRAPSLAKAGPALADRVADDPAYSQTRLTIEQRLSVAFCLR